MYVVMVRHVFIVTVSCLFVVAVRVSMQGWEEMYPEISEVQPQERV